MLKLLHFYFIPHARNNHRAKALHLSSLSLLVLFIAFFQLTLTFFTRLNPGVLGVVANLSVQKIVEITNRYRRENGLAPLVLSKQLQDSANAKASDMLNLNYWSHSSPLGKSPWWFFKSVGYNYLSAGENLARDFDNEEAVVKAWMESATHRENILSKNYQEIGIAVVTGVLNNEDATLVVQHFGVPAQKQIASAVNNQINSSYAGSIYVAEGKKEDKEFINLPVEQPVELSLRPTQLAMLNQELISSSAILSSFSITKRISLLLLSLILLALFLDILFVRKDDIVRISGKSLAHFIFISLITLAILFTLEGRII